ncbi:MAG: CBS domain-containing protein [Bacteroidaceae bacterium]|nr:CBS domain-containing protein [Bacteroidaceae bacterium]
MVSPQFQELVAAIRTDKQPREITPRLLLEAFGYCKRTEGVCNEVDGYLNENSLIAEPHYNEVWLGATILLKHKPIATTNIQKDPIRRINVIDSATSTPKYIDNSATLLDATTIMQANGYSQLPVTTNGERGLIGYISWETICQAKINGIESEMVKDYVERNVATLTPDTPLIQAVEVVRKHDFAIILAKDKSLYGIVTVSDITSQFIAETEPFVLMNELESHLRNLLRDKILLEDLNSLCGNSQNSGHDNITSIDDLTFGDYITIFGNETQWQKLGIAADRAQFIAHLDDIRLIRNDIMHFRPDGITLSQRIKIKSVLRYLRKLAEYQKR